MDDLTLAQRLEGGRTPARRAEGSGPKHGRDAR
jgi:hypothetical protein